MKYRFKLIKGLLLLFIFQYASSLIAADDGLKIEIKLPKSVTNNAVAVATIHGKKKLFSFNGLSHNKTYQDIHNKAYSINLVTGESKQIKSVPGEKGKLASIAVTIDNRILVIGGYTVAADHTEISSPSVVEYLPMEDRYRLITQMPVPVDDTVALTYQQRFVYLISGWHDTDNVNLVQVYDLKENRWFNATSFPGAPVFGHAGGIVGNQLLIADGVKVESMVKGKNIYMPSDENWLGEINPRNPAVIDWKKIKKHPFKPFYRMAAVGVSELNKIVFVGGSDNPYNYNGIGYDGVPSKPSANVFSFDLLTQEWDIHRSLKQPSMDHRGLLFANDEFYVVGGMGANQEVLDSVSHFQLKHKGK